MNAENKAYIVVIEELRDHYEEPSILVGEVCHTSLETAMKEFHEKVLYAKTEEAGDYDWLASSLKVYPSNIKERWRTERYVEFSDTMSGDKLYIYIHEVVIR